MRRITAAVFFTACTVLSAQQTADRLGFYTTLDADIGLDLASIIRNTKEKTIKEQYAEPPGKFHYGFSLLAGYQLLNRFSISGGVRYSFIDPNYHLIYYKVQPNFFLGDPKNQDFMYIFANFGSKLNHTAAKNAGFAGIGIGKIEPLNQRFGHQFQISLDDQIIDGNATVFIGLSYGIILFSNKNL